LVGPTIKTIGQINRNKGNFISFVPLFREQFLWRAAVAATTTTARRIKGIWSSLSLGLSL
jgi:hypothetical protein